MVSTSRSCVRCTAIMMAVLLGQLALAGCGEDAPAAGRENDTVAADAAVDTSAGDVAEAPQDAGKPACVTDQDCGASVDPCLVKRCVQGAVCATVALPDGALCSDGDACTEGDLCKASKCAPGAAKSCDDGESCTADTCDPSNGQCAGKPAVGVACDDDQPCTANDACDSNGKCVGEPFCQCQSTADCAKREDGNACNGTMFCDKSAAKWLCKVNPATVVSCDQAGATACTKRACDPATGQCGDAHQGGSASCNDGDPCTGNDHCDGKGGCKGDVDTCKCTQHTDCVSQDDGNLCNGTLFCQQSTGKCLPNPASIVACKTDNDTACTKATCQPKSGACLPAAVTNGVACDDGDSCSASDACKDGSCAPGIPLCSCGSDADCAKHEDGNLCNGTMFCDKAKKKCRLNPTTIVVCDASQHTACAKNTCAPKTGKCSVVPLPASATCDADGSACTAVDTCDGDGGCKPGLNICPCQADADCATLEDNNACNGTLFCNKQTHNCAVNPKTVVACPTWQNSACLVNECQPKTGACALKARNDGGICDADDTPCTPFDTCVGGKCTVGSNLCDCAVDADCDAIAKPSKCGGALYCDKSKLPFRCLVNPATVLKCAGQSGSACKKVACDPATGKCGELPAFETKPCDDGEACTFADQCSGGKCSGVAKDCGDGGACVTIACKDGKCSSAFTACEDHNVCTLDFCNPVLGCQHSPLPAGATACDADGDPCTTPDACNPATGQCLPGPKKSCDDGNGCTTTCATWRRGNASTARRAGCAWGARA